VLIALTPEFMVTATLKCFCEIVNKSHISEATQKRDGLDFVCRRISAPAWGDFIVDLSRAERWMLECPKRKPLRDVMPKNQSRLWLRRGHHRQLPHARMSARLEPLAFPYRREPRLNPDDRFVR
jgi:hypothetical protein